MGEKPVPAQAPVTPNPAPVTPFKIRAVEPKHLRDVFIGKVPLTPAPVQAPVKPVKAKLVVPKPLKDFLTGKVKQTPAPIRAPVMPTPAPATPAQTPILTQQTFFSIQTTPRTTTTRCRVIRMSE